ncbi:MAG: ribosome silencing factor [Syntrophomonadaceae bacterium]|nr:ribosome silencing factor [Syntrophomonadaceae bacterium]
MSTAISTDLTSKIVESAKEANATDIVVLDLRGLTILADYFVIASGRSTIQVKSIAEKIEDQLLEQGEKPVRREGFNEGRWIILDYSGVMVHIFRQEEREFYQLERLWSDAPLLKVGSSQV